MEIPGNKPSRLGEILNSAASSIYFTEQSAVYFYCISIVFLLYFYCISIVFPPYFYRISTFYILLFPNQIQHPASHLSGFDHFDHPIVRSHWHILAIIGTIPSDIWVLGVEQT